MEKRRAASPNRIQEILRTVDLFKVLPDEDLERVVAIGEVRWLERGEILFRSGDPPDRIHLILDGAIEIVRPTPDHPEPVPVAYITPGELIGDMALFTGTDRHSDGRVPETAQVWTLTRQGFDELTESIPDLGIELARVFAHRLQDFISQMRRQSRRKELAGKLEYFDMPTVVQTLLSSNQTGVLTFINEEGETFAEVMLRNGNVDRARCGILEGEEAFYEIFLHRDQGEFIFRTVVEPDPDAISEVPISPPAMHLLMEAMRLSDEFYEIREQLPDPDKPFMVKTIKLVWDKERTAPIAEAILTKLRKPQRLDELKGQIPCSTFRLYKIASELYETRQIGI